MTPAETPPRAGRREWLGLAVLALPTLMVSLDVFVMLLALPRLSASLHASSSQQLWVMDVYGFMVAGFMITMGALGDRIGRRRLLLAAAVAFGAASPAAAYSTSPGMLIACRALLGIAGAALTPSTLSLISTMFRDSRQRASAIGIWAGAFTVGAIIGPIVGGVMLQHFWWGSVLLLGVPAMLVLLAVGPVVLPEYRSPRAGRLDPLSVGLALAAILPTVYGLKELARTGWHALPALTLAAGLALGVLFVRRQGRLTDPLLDIRLFAGRAFSTTLAGMFAYTALSGGIMVVVAQYFQLVEGMSPLRAGLTLVPGMAAAIISFQACPLLARRIRPAYLLSGGLVTAVAGLLIMTLASPPPAGGAVLVIGFVLASLGSGPLVTLGTNLVVSSAPPERAGSASAVAQTGNEFGYALGVAVIGSIVIAVYRARITAAFPAAGPAARDTLVGAVQAARNLHPQAAGLLLGAARDAFSTGLHVAAWAAAAVLAALAVLIVTTLRGLPTPARAGAGSSRMESPQPGEGADSAPASDQPPGTGRTRRSQDRERGMTRNPAVPGGRPPSHSAVSVHDEERL
jgi:DHA2 family multidrug resistance protein-like MFS transporter